MMNKKGIFGIRELVSLIIAIAILVIMYYVIFYFNDIREALIRFFADFNVLERFK